MNTGIIVDTCVWIEFFRKPESELTTQLKSLIRKRRVIMVGMVLAEVLQGIKVPKEAKIVKQHLEKLPYIEMRREAWEKAGEMSASLRSKGITIPLSDLIIAALAILSDNELLTIDPHFKNMKELKLYDTYK